MQYYDGRHYDARVEYREDIPFWLKKAHRYGGPILELGCGTGRVSIELARAGFEVVGLDIEESMLAQARCKSRELQLDVEWIKADCRNFELGRSFKLIIFPFNSLSHIVDQEGIESCLACVSHHLEHRGRFIFDLHNPRLDILMRNPNKRYPHSRYEDPDGHGEIVVTESNQYDRASQVNTITLFYTMPNGREETAQILSRMFFPQELDLLLRSSGFLIEEKFGDFDETPFTSESPKQIVICRLADNP